MNDVETTTAREIALFTELGAHPDRHHGVILIPKSEVRPLLGALLGRGTRILGLDGFKRLPDNKIQPFMEFSPDYSDAQPSERDIETFLASVPDKISHFEVVVDLETSNQISHRTVDPWRVNVR